MPPSRRRRWPWLVAASAVAVALVVVTLVLVTRSRPLADDPVGRNACNSLAQWIRGDLKNPRTGQPLGKALAADLLGQQAHSAKTAEIRAAAGEDLADDPVIGAVVKGSATGLRFANLPRLRAACAGAGVTMPAYAEPGA